MTPMPWLDREFPVELTPALIPNLVERLAGTTHRIRALTDAIPAEALTASRDDTWSIQRNVGHLLDLEPLWMTRTEELLAGASELSPADVTNPRTRAADHDDVALTSLIDGLEASRAALLRRVMDAPANGRRHQARHPRLGTPMGLPDLLFFVAEHDDHHLARIRELLRVTIIENVGDLAKLDWKAHHRPARTRGVLMCPPDAFDVIDVRNVHMEGMAGTVDRARARAEWDGLVDALRDVGLEVHELHPEAGLVDMVFTANPCLVGVDRAGETFAVLSHMRHAGRVGEVSHHVSWLKAEGIRLLRLPEDAGGWEGGGDSIWHPDHFVLWGGVGPRSDRSAFAALSHLTGATVILLRLEDPAFYHLDTCFIPLDTRRAAFVPAAFDDTGRALLHEAFETLVEVDDGEARTRLAGNLYCPDGRHVLLPAGSPRTRERLESEGFEVREVVTDEFLKAGGSLYCLRQELF